MIRFPIPHYILAGGRSRRFGSDKARHEIDGLAMVARVAEAFAEVAGETLVVAREAGAYKDLGLATVADEVEHAGPVGGLYSALLRAQRMSDDARAGDGDRWVLVTSCDLIAPEVADVRALAGPVSAGHEAAVFRSARFFEPFPGLYSLAVLSDVRAALGAGAGSMQGLLAGLGERVSALPIPAGRPYPFDLDQPGGE